MFIMLKLRSYKVNMIQEIAQTVRQHYLHRFLEEYNVSALPTPSFPLGTADLPLLNKSGYHENTEVSGNVCQSG